MNIITVRQARARIARAFEADPHFRRGYVDTVACVIMDNIPWFKRDKSKRDAVAEKIIKHLFE